MSVMEQAVNFWWEKLPFTKTTADVDYDAPGVKTHNVGDA